MQSGDGGSVWFAAVSALVSLVDAVGRDVAALVVRAPALRDSALVAVALALAAEVDRPGNSATSKSLCARCVVDAMERLREMAPPVALDDAVDDLASRRSERQARAAAG